jgi:hypothetical protein
MKHDRSRLTIPLNEAFAFAMGWSNLHYGAVSAPMRQVMGLLVVDSLEYAEEWRASARARACLQEKWPELYWR